MSQLYVYYFVWINSRITTLNFSNYGALDYYHILYFPPIG